MSPEFIHLIYFFGGLAFSAMIFWGWRKDTMASLEHERALRQILDKQLYNFAMKWGREANYSSIEYAEDLKSQTLPRSAKISDEDDFEDEQEDEDPAHEEDLNAS